ncbi:MAG: WD40 repeat domain-containing protein [Candidatus Hydrogenedentes bacterium]|nr:WD40 repeat domain-containing protein [Candidatus Hydrogenedentota bacterium]
MKTLPIHFLVAMLLMLVWAAGVPAQQPRLIMSGAPEFVGLCIDANLYIVKQENTIVAYDMNSGGTRWSYDAWPPDMYLQAQQGKNRVVLYGKDEERYRVVVLEKASGKELWEHTERAPDAFRGVMVLPDSDWFLLRYARDKARNENREEDYFLLFSPDGAGRYRLPEDLWPREWQEEGKTLVLTGPGKEGIRLVHWDLETNTTRDIGTYSDGLYSGRLHSGRLLLYRYLKEKQPQHTLKVVDGDSGRLLRQVALPGDIGSPPILAGDGKAMLALANTGDRLWMLDTGDDKVLATLHQPGHEFLLTSVDTDASGRIWVVSRDDQNQIYLWPVEPGTAPRKIFDRGPFLSGYPIKIIPPHVITVTHSDNGITTLHAYNFEERRVAAVWKPSSTGYLHNALPCASMRRCAVMLPGSDQAQRYGGYKWEILESGASEPLVNVENTWALTLSPDGEYAVAPPPEKAAVLIRVSTGEKIYEFPLDDEATWIWAAFASDSRTVAVYGGFDAYTVVRITEDGVRETPLEFHRGTWLSAQCFSLDGTRLLSATRGEAWLHDTTTGRLLHTFVEPQQLRSEYVHTPEVFGIKMPFVNYLGDLAGNFTNLANSKPELDAAFIGNGAWLVTLAESQLMRVWDAQTGQSVHVIDVGLSNTRDEQGFMRNSIMLSGNGAYALASNRFDTRATLWDLKTGTAIKKWSDWKGLYQPWHVSDDGKSIYLTIGNSMYWLEGK